MSFYTSLSGLQASQSEMNVISHNLANVSTNGFKKSRSEFADVIASSLSISPTQMVGSGVATKAVRQQFAQGSLTQSSSSLDLAIAGDGFFAVKPKVGEAQVDYTRNGSFMVDSDRYVVDSQGSHLQVFPVDGTGNIVTGGIDQTVSLRLPQTSGNPVPTSKVQLAVNLNNSAPVSTKPFDRFDTETFDRSTTTTVYDTDGSAHSMNTYYVRKSAAEGTPPTSSWEVHNFVDDKEVFPAGTKKPITATFDANGALTSPSGSVAMDPVSFTASGVAQTLSFDMTGSTQSIQPFNVADRNQDGVAIGQLQGVTIDDSGLVKATFSNGEGMTLGKVALANFSNPSGLRQMGNSYWSATGIAGAPKLGAAGDNGYGSLMSSMIEGSNVDITEELVGLIAAQRNFQANAKALDTASQISQSIFNIRT